MVYQQANAVQGVAGLQASGSQAAGSPPAAAPTAPAAAPPGPADVLKRESASLTLKGVGADNLAVAEFVVGLRDAGVFERVDLKSAAESGSTKKSSTAYQVECGF